MRRQSAEKLKDLLADIPLGYLIDSSMLARYEIDHRLVHKYVKRGWLQSVARGLYVRPLSATRPDPKLPWHTVFMSMMLMQYPVHVGGVSALSLRGYQHYLPVGDAQEVHLYGDAVPTWLHRIETTPELVVKSLALFQDTEMGVSEYSPSDPEFGTLSDAQSLASVMRVSDPERAVLEALNNLPKGETFHNMDMMFEALTNLRPSRLQSLLNSCKSVKVKRLFFVFADRHGHAWRSYLSPDDFDLGSGARSLGNGGKFHPKYNISVPEKYLRSLDQEDMDGP